MSSGLDELNATLEALGGCGDGDCKVYVRPGMHTNGGCRCLRDDKYKAERVISAYRRYVRFAEATRAPSDAALVEALDACKVKFAEYALLHYRKRTPDGDEKAMANQRMADMCDAALAAAKGQQP